MIRLSLFYICLFCASSAFAGNQLGFDSKLTLTIESQFLVDGEFSSEKIDKYRKNLLERKAQLTQLIKNFEGKFKNESPEKVQKEINKSDSLFVYNLLLERLDLIEKTSDLNAKKRMAQEILGWDYATKVTGADSLATAFKGYVSHFPGSNTLYKKVGVLGEASNLYNKEKGEFYSQDELKLLADNGVDLSTLDPGHDQKFWFDRDIEKASPSAVMRGYESPLYSGMHIELPSKKGKYKKLRSTQSKPKIDFTHKVTNPFTGKKEKRTFKLKVGSEMHAEITAAGLLGSLGFHTDLTKYVRNFKITLPDGMGVEDLKKEWYSYDKFRLFDLDELVSEVGVDEKGRTYLVFIEGLIETKPEELFRIGPWPFGELGHQGRREVRALHLFNIWIANNDVKESDNNKLVLKKNEKGEFDTFQYMHDIGFAFGFFLKEAPQSFKWNVVKKNTRNAIKFNYVTFQPHSGFDHVTFSDAKWMVRKIARLSRNQIEEAVEIGGWPADVGALLVEKLISRRNGLVKAFELENEFSELPFERNITTKSGKVVNGEVTNEKFSGYTQTFGGEIKALTKPVQEAVERVAIEGARYLNKGLRDFTIAAETVGLDSKIVAELRLKVDREVIANPHPLGIDDNFLVRDIFKVRYALGAGIILRGKGAYFQEFSLIYPAKTFKVGAYNNGFIFNALLPRHIRTVKLPENYILVANHGIEGEGEIFVGTQSLGGAPGVSAGLAFTKGTFGGFVVGKSPTEFTVYKDSANYNQVLARIYAEFLILRIPLLEMGREHGILYRDAYKIEISDDDPVDKETKLNDLAKFISTGNIEKLRDKGAKTEIVNNYVKKSSNLKLFFYNRKTEKRIDKIKRTIEKEDNSFERKDFFQIDILRKKNLGFFGGGEIKARRFRFKGNLNTDGSIQKPSLDIQLMIEDSHTQTKELRDHYIKNINQLALSSKFIDFSPELFSKNNIWGLNRVHLRMIYDEEGLNKLIQTPSDIYYQVIAESSNRNASFWKSRGGRDEIDKNSYNLRKRYQRFVNAMNKARLANDGADKFEIVIEAFNKLIRSKGDAFDLVLMQRIHKILGHKGFFFEGYITIPESREMRYPDKTPLYNVMNAHILKKQEFIEFDFDDILETWELFF